MNTEHDCLAALERELEYARKWSAKCRSTENHAVLVDVLMAVRAARTEKPHQHTDECWEPDSGCDMGRNEKYVVKSAEPNPAPEIASQLRSEPSNEGSGGAVSGAGFTDEQIKHMVNRFLGWRLPDDFNPDCGISFKALYNEHRPLPSVHQPVGTNLFDATQAEAMVRFMIEGLTKEVMQTATVPNDRCESTTKLATPPAVSEAAGELAEAMAWLNRWANPLHNSDVFRDAKHSSTILAHIGKLQLQRNEVAILTKDFNAVCTEAEQLRKQLAANSSAGTFACPICGGTAPHRHNDEEIESYKGRVQAALDRYRRGLDYYNEPAVKDVQLILDHIAEQAREIERLLGWWESIFVALAVGLHKGEFPNEGALRVVRELQAERDAAVTIVTQLALNTDTQQDVAKAIADANKFLAAMKGEKPV